MSFSEIARSLTSLRDQDSAASRIVATIRAGGPSRLGRKLMCKSKSGTRACLDCVTSALPILRVALIRSPRSKRRFPNSKMRRTKPRSSWLAFTGMSLSELHGLRFSDAGEDQIKVRTSYWRTHEGTTKIKARHAAIPLLPLVASAIADHRKRNPDSEFVFEGPYQRPIGSGDDGQQANQDCVRGKWC